MNVMLLADMDGAGDSSTTHHFLYGHVLGAYHANIIYTGPGMHDFEACWLDFLWVRWYEVVNALSEDLKSPRLGSICFHPMNEENMFGFVDPKDVL